MSFKKYVQQSKKVRPDERWAYFLESFGFSDEYCKKIIRECALYNKDLYSFLNSSAWWELPFTTIYNFIEAYNNSEVNIKTGKIIAPATELEHILISEKLQELKVGCNVTLAKTKEPVEFEIFLVSRDIDGNYLDTISWRKQNTKGITYHEEIKGQNILSFFKINLNDLPREVWSIRVFVKTSNHLSHEESELYKKFFVSIQNNNSVFFTAREDITSEMKLHPNIYIFEIFKNINEWIIDTPKITKDVVLYL